MGGLRQPLSLLLPLVICLPVCVAGEGAVGRVWHFPLFSSSRVVQLILELGIMDVHIESMDYMQMKTADYGKVNPHGTVPAYEEEDAGFVLLESSAIITYLLEKYDKEHRLLPADPVQRARYYQWAHYAPATLYTRAGGLYVHAWEFREGTEGAGRQSKPAIAESSEWLKRQFVPFIMKSLDKYDYLLGDNFTAADIVMGWEMMLLEKAGFLAEVAAEYPQLQAYFARLAARPSFQKTYPEEIHTLCIWPHKNEKCKALHVELLQSFQEEL